MLRCTTRISGMAAILSIGMNWIGYRVGSGSSRVLRQTELPQVGGVDPTGQDAKEVRALITGTHTQQFSPDLLVRAKVF